MALKDSFAIRVMVVEIDVSKRDSIENAVQTERIYNCRFKNEEGKKLKFVVTF